MILKTSVCAVCSFLCKLQASSINYLKTFPDGFPLDVPAVADNMLSSSAGASSFAGQAATPVADSYGFTVTSSFIVRNAYSYFSIDFRHSFRKIMYIYISSFIISMKGADPGGRAV